MRVEKVKEINMDKIVNRFFKWLWDNNIYNACGCDACHFEAYDFKYFYWYKDWDVKNPKWVFSFRKQS